jgi:membrane protein
VPALTGGIVAGSIWHVTQWTYIQFQFGMRNYNAIYGAMAQLPLLMAWVYVSWVIVLFGAEIAFAVQNVMRYSRERRAAHLTGQALRDRVGLSMCALLARAAKGVESAPTFEELSDQLDVSLSLVCDIAAVLEADGIVHQSDEALPRCYLSRTPDRIGIAGVLDVLRGGRPELVELANDDDTAAVRDVLVELTDARDVRIGARTLADLV